MPPRRREILSWALYDFANSAFATSIIAVVFATYFTRSVVPPEGFSLLGRSWSGEALWNFAGAVSMGLVCLSAPFIGAISDYTAAKKRLLAAYWLIGCLATGLLFFVHPGMVVFGAALFIVANMGFAGGNALYNAFLPELGPPEGMARLSSLGWGLGYAGGGLCLLLNLGMLKTWSVGACFAVVAAWWFLFALPLFFFLRERAAPRPIPAGRSLAGAGFADVFRTLKNIRRHRELFKFLLAYLLFNEGVETVIFNAAVYGQSVVGMRQKELIAVYLVVQAVALGGALLFGEIARRLKCKRAILVTLFIWLGVLIFAFFVVSRTMFWILGICVGLVMGGTQALSRGLFGEMTPKEKTAEFFGFFAIGGKFAAALGPLLFGAVTQATGTMRWGILSVGAFFLGGLLLLLWVDEERGLREAAYFIPNQGPV